MSRCPKFHSANSRSVPALCPHERGLYLICLGSEAQTTLPFPSQKRCFVFGAVLGSKTEPLIWPMLAGLRRGFAVTRSALGPSAAIHHPYPAPSDRAVSPAKPIPHCPPRLSLRSVPFGRFPTAAATLRRFRCNQSRSFSSGHPIGQPARSGQAQLSPDMSAAVAAIDSSVVSAAAKDVIPEGYRVLQEGKGRVLYEGDGAVSFKGPSPSS